MQYRHIAKIVGVKNFINLVKLLGDTTWYIPKFKTILNEAMKTKIKKEYNGYNKKALAIKYDMSERTIQNILCIDNMGEQLKIF